MAKKYMSSAVITSGDTVKTTGGTLTAPKNAKRLLGVWAHMSGGPGVTTLESRAGLFELESTDYPDVMPCQIPLDPDTSLTGGCISKSVKVWPLDIAIGNNGPTFTGWFTMDMTQTINPTGRWGLVFEV
jgi:hypothetical protein